MSLDYEYCIDVRFVVVSDDGDGDDVLDGTSSLHAGVLYTEEEGLELHVTCSGNQAGGVKFLPLADLPGTGGQLPEIPPLTAGRPAPDPLRSVETTTPPPSIEVGGGGVSFSIRTATRDSTLRPDFWQASLPRATHVAFGKLPTSTRMGSRGRSRVGPG
jgi:hypothetical protein